MRVTAVETFLSPSGQRRARICRRDDGRFQIVTETFRQATDDCESHWMNDHPPSGLFASRADARAELRLIVPGASELHDPEPCTFEIDIGPYPDPVRRTSA
jgi:hypothetical protein